jgi:hypothetical protein
VLPSGSLTHAKDAAALRVVLELPGGPPATKMDTQQQASASKATPPCFPLEMRQRGVSQQRYEADMAAFEALHVQSSSDESTADLLCCTTLGMSRLVQLWCCGEPSDLRNFVQNASSRCDDMNVYYNRYGIRWYVDHTPGLGASILYEFDT